MGASAVGEDGVTQTGDVSVRNGRPAYRLPGGDVLRRRTDGVRNENGADNGRDLIRNPTSATGATMDEAVHFYKKMLTQNSKLRESDLEQVIQLRDKYKQQSNIVLPEERAARDTV